jgi:hypothetical protein
VSNLTTRNRSYGLKLARLEGSLTSQNAPGDAGTFVGERNGEHAVVRPLLGCLDPGFEPVALPALWLDQHDPRGLEE